MDLFRVVFLERIASRAKFCSPYHISNPVRQGLQCAAQSTQLQWRMAMLRYYYHCACAPLGMRAVLPVCSLGAGALGVPYFPSLCHISAYIFCRKCL